MVLKKEVPYFPFSASEWLGCQLSQISLVPLGICLYHQGSTENSSGDLSGISNIALYSRGVGVGGGRLAESLRIAVVKASNSVQITLARGGDLFPLELGVHLALWLVAGAIGIFGVPLVENEASWSRIGVSQPPCRASEFYRGYKVFFLGLFWGT